MTREHEVLCDCNFDEGHEPTCAIVAAHKRISDAVRYPWMHGAESVHSGKQNTADKSWASPELLPTQLPKEK